jgi:hypothetical protein
MNNQQTLSQIIEISGAILQIAIIVLLLLRRQVGRFPAFTAILFFYLLRATLYFSVSRYADHLKFITAVQWNHIVIGFSIADAALQVAVLTELALWLVPMLGAWRQRSWLRLGIGAAVAIGFAAVMLYKLGYWPSTSPIPHAVSGQLLLLNSHVALAALLSELLLLAALATVAPNLLRTPTQSLAKKLALGWGIYGSVNLLGLAVGHYAMEHGNAALWTHMQYIAVGGYLLMQVLWLLSLLIFAETKPVAAPAA